MPRQVREQRGVLRRPVGPAAPARPPAASSWRSGGSARCRPARAPAGAAASGARCWRVVGRAVQGERRVALVDQPRAKRLDQPGLADARPRPRAGPPAPRPPSPTATGRAAGRAPAGAPGAALGPPPRAAPRTGPPPGPSPATRQRLHRCQRSPSAAARPGFSKANSRPGAGGSPREHHGARRTHRVQARWPGGAPRRRSPGTSAVPRRPRGPTAIPTRQASGPAVLQPQPCHRLDRGHPRARPARCRPRAPGPAEAGEHAVALVRGGPGRRTGDRLGDRALERAQHLPHVLRVEAGGERGRIDQVDERDHELPPLRGGLDPRRPALARRSLRGRRLGEAAPRRSSTALP